MIIVEESSWNCELWVDGTSEWPWKRREYVKQEQNMWEDVYNYSIDARYVLCVRIYFAQEQ